MKSCGTCQEEFDDRRVFCPNDGATLEPASDPMIGIVLDGKYRIEERLGRGGMGAVYRARHLLIGDTVAIKVLRTDLAESRDAVERLRREARAARHLRNPHVIQVIDFSATADGLVYLVMDFVDGQSLRELLARESRLEPVRAAVLVTQIAGALDDAHAHGIVHRDLKPDNVMVETLADGSEFVRVLDFGIAKLGGDTRPSTLTADDVILGTPCYLSPEQCGAGEVGGWSDVYSLGVLAYELVTGRVPFDGAKPTEVARKHLFSEPRPPGELAPGLGEQAEATILKAMAKEPEDRYASAGAFAAAFEAAVGREGLADTATLSRRAVVPETARILGRPTDQEVRSPRRRTPGWLPWALLALSGAVLATVLVIPRSGTSPASPPSSSPAAPDSMVLVPAGEFLMGSSTGREDCQDEHPPRAVFLPDFFIDRTEVTNAEYRAFCDATSRPYPPPPGWDAGYFEKGDMPVINVTWKDASDYAKWAGKRLPTEAEWEKAARGTDGRTYPWGEALRAGLTTLDGRADGFDAIAPVGSFPDGASPYGCLDMVGNVYEWTADWYAPYPGSDGSWDRRGDTGFKKRVVRGGDFKGRLDRPFGITRASERFCEPPDYRGANLGFRCVRTP